MKKTVSDLFKALVTEIEAAHYEHGSDQPGRDERNRQGRRHQYQLIAEGSFGYCPDDRYFPLRPYSGDFLGVHRQIVSQHPGRLLGGNLGHHGHVIENSGNVVQ